MCIECDSEKVREEIVSLWCDGRRRTIHKREEREKVFLSQFVLLGHDSLYCDSYSHSSAVLPLT